MTARTFLVLAAVAGCAHATGAARPPRRDRARPRRTSGGLSRAIGRRSRPRFAARPSIDDPFAGAVRGDACAGRVRRARHALAHGARGADRRPVRSRAPAGRTVVEAVLRLHHEGRDVDSRSPSSPTTRPTGACARCASITVLAARRPSPRPPAAAAARSGRAHARAPSPTTSARSPPATSTRSSRPSRRTDISASRPASPGSTAAPSSCASS